MTGRETLRNVTYFLRTILPEAYSSVKWTSETVDEAFLWAEYCEQVYKKADGHPKVKELDACIRAIGIEIEGEQTNISLEHIKLSTRLLIKAFLQNQMIETSVIQFVFDRGKQKGFDMDQLNQENIEMRNMCSDALHLLQLFTESKRKCTSLVKEMEAEFLMQHIKDEISSHITEDKIEKWLNEYLKTLCEKEEKIEIVLYVLLLEPKIDSLPHIFQRFCMMYLLQRATIGHHLFDLSMANNIWKQPVILLRTVATKHLLFYKCYVDGLFSMAQGMTLNFSDNVPSWVVMESTDIPQLSFSDIVAHFRCLCDAQDKTSKATKTLLYSLIENSEESPIWKDILHHIMSQDC